MISLLNCQTNLKPWLVREVCSTYKYFRKWFQVSPKIYLYKFFQVLNCLEDKNKGWPQLEHQFEIQKFCYQTKQPRPQIHNLKQLCKLHWIRPGLFTFLLFVYYIFVCFLFLIFFWLFGYRTGRTTVIVAHRLSTIRSADKIVALKDGQVIEIGKYLFIVSEHFTQYIYKSLKNANFCIKISFFLQFWNLGIYQISCNNWFF